MNNQFLIWIPAYNEEAHVKTVLSEIKSLGLDCVLSDAGSTDNTVRFANEMGVKTLERSGKGKGHSIQDSLLYADKNQYNYIFYMDCDGTYSSQDLVKLIKNLANHDMLVGYRDFTTLSPSRRAANLLMSGFFNLLNRTNYKDVASGLRMISVKAFKGKVLASGFDVEPHLCAIAVKNDFNYLEIPISYKSRDKGSKAKPWDLIPVFYRMFKDWLFL